MKAASHTGQFKPRLSLNNEKKGKKMSDCIYVYNNNLSGVAEGRWYWLHKDYGDSIISQIRYSRKE